MLVTFPLRYITEGKGKHAMQEQKHRSIDLRLVVTDAGLGGRFALLGIGRGVVVDAPFLTQSVDLQMQALGEPTGRSPVRYGAAANAEDFGDTLVAAEQCDDFGERLHASHYSRGMNAVKRDQRELIWRTGIGIMPRIMVTADSRSRTVPAIAARLKQTRTALRLTQVAFASGAGIAPNTYNQWEKAKQRPDLDQAQMLCDHYDLSLDWIYRGDPSRLPYELAAKILGMETA